MGKQMAKLLIRNGSVWNGKEFVDGDVAIAEGKIVAVGNTDGFEPEYSYDAKGGLICPGLIDSHVHLAKVSIDQWGCLPEATMYPLGVTAVAEAGCGTTSKAVDEFKLKTVLFVCTSIVDDDVDFDEVEKLLAAHPGRAIGLKAYYDVGTSDVQTIAPLRKICDYAHEHGLKVMVHCTNPPVPMAQVLGCLGKGDICTHIFHGIGHTVVEDDFACLREAHERGVILDSGLAGGFHCSYDIIAQALERGLLPDTLSSDAVRLSSFRRGGCYGLPMVMTIFRNLGMPEEAVLRSVTSTAAQVMNRADEWGMLEPGRNADVTVLGYGDLEIDSTDRTGGRFTSDKGYYCKLNIADGDIVYRNARD